MPSALSPIVANPAGVITAHFTIPSGIPAGNKRIRLIGANGSYGESIFSGQGSLVRTTMQQVTTVTESRWESPPPPPPVYYSSPPIEVTPAWTNTPAPPAAPNLLIHINEGGGNSGANGLTGGGATVFNQDTGANIHVDNTGGGTITSANGTTTTFTPAWAATNLAKPSDFYTALTGVQTPPSELKIPTFVWNSDQQTAQQAAALNPTIGNVAPLPFCLTDPVAETFVLNAGALVAGVDLWFSAIGDQHIAVQLRTTSNGYPAKTVLAAAVVLPTSVSTSGSTRVLFKTPVWMDADQEYALVIMADEATTAVRIAELGKYDASASKWVTEQPYQVGVMFTSSNATAWTAHQDRDLTFRLLTTNHTQTSRTITLGAVTVTAVTDLMMMGYADRFTADSDCKYRLTLGNGTVYTVTDGQNVKLDVPYTGTVSIDAVLTGSAAASPIFHPGSQLVAGVVGSQASYVTRAIPATSGTRLRVVYEADIPSGAAVTPSWKGSNLGATFTSIPMVTSVMVDSGFREYTFEQTGLSGLTWVQVQLALQGNCAARPRVRNLRCYVV